MICDASFAICKFSTRFQDISLQPSLQGLASFSTANSQQRPMKAPFFLVFEEFACGTWNDSFFVQWSFRSQIQSDRPLKRMNGMPRNPKSLLQGDLRPPICRTPWRKVSKLTRSESSLQKQQYFPHKWNIRNLAVFFLSYDLKKESWVWTWKKDCDTKRTHLFLLYFMKVVDWFQQGRKGPNGCMKFAVCNFGPFHGAKKPVQTAFPTNRSGWKLQKSQQKFAPCFFPEASEPYVCSETEKAEGWLFPSKTTRTRRGPLTTICGFIPCYTHLQPWLNRVCWGYNYLITRGAPSCIKKL